MKQLGLSHTDVGSAKGHKSWRKMAISFKVKILIKKSAIPPLDLLIFDQEKGTQVYKKYRETTNIPINI